MRILKFLVAALLSVVAAGSLQAQRPDSDVQAKAREALEQAVAEQNATNQVKTPPKKTPPVTRSQAQPAPVSTPAPVVTTPAPSPVVEATTPAPASAEAEREAHLQELEAARAKQAAATPAPAVEVAPAPAQATTPYHAELSPDDEAKARAAMRQAAEQYDAQHKTGTVPPATRATALPPPAHTPAPTTATAAQPAYKGFQPSVTSAATEPPPAPARAMTPKQRQLDDLLNKYKMDQITPQEYFQQKAKILAEPGQ